MIKLTRSKTVCLTVYSLENIKDILNDQIKFSKIDQLFQETLLMELRGKSISYSDYKKKEAETREKDITKNIEILESNFSESSSNKNRLDTLKEEHSIIRKNKMQGILLKSRTQIVEDVEKNIKRFCNLEKHNYNSKIMPNLERKDAKFITDQFEILNDAKKFHEDLYSNKDNNLTDIDLDNLFINSDIRKLNQKHLTSKKDL